MTGIGGEGSGPGEFQSLLRFFIDQKDRLFAFDIQQAWNTIFVESDNSWEPDRVFMIEGQRYGIESADGDDNLILRQSLPQYPEPGAYWYEHELATGHLELGLDQQNVHTFREMGNLVRDDGYMQMIPYGRTTILSTDLEGNLYMVWNEAFQLAKYDPELEFIDSLSVSIPNQPIRADERNQILDRLDENFRSLGREHIPESKPVITNMFIDRYQNFWLQTFDSPEYLVFDKEGNPLGSFDLYDDLELMHVDDNQLYTLKVGDQGYEIQVFSYQL